MQNILSTPLCLRTSSTIDEHLLHPSQLILALCVANAAPSVKNVKNCRPKRCHTHRASLNITIIKMIMANSPNCRGLIREVRAGAGIMPSPHPRVPPLPVGRRYLSTLLGVKHRRSTYSIPNLKSKLLGLLCLGLGTCLPPRCPPYSGARSVVGC